jgi:hypothetical protein
VQVCPVVCIMETDLANGQSSAAIEVFCSQSSIPLLIYTTPSTPELEEQAYLQGAACVLVKPVRAKLLITLLKRLRVTPTMEATAHVIIARFRAEAGNYLVPIETFHRMLVERRATNRLDEEFLVTLETSMGTAMRQLNRFFRKMWFLGAKCDAPPERLPIRPLLERASEVARRQWFGREPQVDIVIEEHLAARASLGYMEYALSELILNAWNANPVEPKVRVSAKAITTGSDVPRIQIEIEDNGPGFSLEALRESNRNWHTIEALAAGGGLVTSCKLVQCQEGTLKILPPKPACHGVVVITLPLARRP